MTTSGLRKAIQEALENPRTDVPGGTYIDRQTETAEEVVREYLTSDDSKRRAIDAAKDKAHEWERCDPTTFTPAEEAKQIALAAVDGLLRED